VGEREKKINLTGQPNALAVWAKQNKECTEAIQEKRSTALKLAIKCINDGTLYLLDGVGSPLSCEIKKHHGVELFEMNRSWVETSQHWRCPCCERSKFEISRLGSKYQILAKLVEHHDHMADAIKAAFNKVFVESGTNKPTNTGLALIERMAPAFSAYAPILICEDCNNSDAAAKKILSAKGDRVEWQSFSIGQIRQFINVGKHLSHGIDESKVMALWLLVRPAYVARMNLVYQVAKAAVLQDYWYERYPVGMVAVPTLSNDYQRYGGLELVNGEALSHEMATSNIVHQANRSRWRTESKPAGNVPPENYLAMLLSLPGCARMWNELEDSWKCPICQRSKFEVVTFMKGKVTFQTHSPTRLSPAWRGIQQICMGCCSVVKAMKWELEKGCGLDVGATFNCIKPDLLRSIITARPHSSPLVDGRKAQSLIDDWLSR
jgi:rubredoxin